MGNLVSSANARWENLRSLAFGGITGAYAAIGTPFLNSAAIVSVINTTNANVLISTDGVNDKMIVVADSGRVFDIGSDKTNQAALLNVPAQTTLYAKAETGDPTTGTIYVEVVYASQT